MSIIVVVQIVNLIAKLRFPKSEELWRNRPLL